MGSSIEWSHISSAFVEATVVPGYFDSDGSINDGPALGIFTGSDGAVIEADSAEEMAAWLRELADKFDPPQVAGKATRSKRDPATWRVRQSHGVRFGGWNIVNAAGEVVTLSDGTPLNFRTREQARHELRHQRGAR